MANKKTFLIFILLIFFSFCLLPRGCFAFYDFHPKKYNHEDTSKHKLTGAQYGFYFGAYFANNYTANYFNGLGKNNIYKAIMDTAIINGITYYYGNNNHQQIRDLLGYDFEIKDTPEQMRYDVATNAGFHLKYNFTDNFATFIEINYVKLRAKGVAHLITKNYLTTTITDKNKIQCSMIGSQSLVDINIGIFKSFGKPNFFKPFIETAFNLNNSTVKDAEIGIPINNITQTYKYLDLDKIQYGETVTAIGYGFLTGGGLQIMFSESVLFQLGANASIKKVVLGDYNAFKPSFNIYFRLLLRNIVTISTE